MANLPEVNNFDAGVYQIETTDAVLGGVGGTMNAPFKNLVNRTRWLYNQILAIAAAAYAPLASPALTGTPTSTTPPVGDNTTKIATAAFVQTLAGGQTTINVAGGANVNLVQAQWGYGILRFTGLLTGNINIVFPNAGVGNGRWLVMNDTTGAFAITCKTAGGAGVTVTQGARAGIFVATGNTIQRAFTDFDTIAITGASTAVTQAAGDASTKLATTAYADASSAAAVAAAVGAGRIVLAGNKTFYVDPAGSDAADGSIGTPWLTIQHAINMILSHYDNAGFTVTIQVNAGAFAGQVSVPGRFTGGGQVLLLGDTGTPTNCQITTGGGVNSVSVAGGAQLNIQGFQIVSSGANAISLFADGDSAITFNHMNFGAVGGAHLGTGAGGRIVGPNSTYTISGGGPRHTYALRSGGSVNINNANIALVGAPAFSIGFLGAEGLAQALGESLNFTGAGSGPGWESVQGGYIDTQGTSAVIIAAGFSAGTNVTGYFT